MAEKILIVDDEVDSLKLIGLMLKRHGYEVSVAETGGKALEKAESGNPDLIILDVMMPDMNGLEVCRRLRANPKTANTPIIMFTAKTMIDDKVQGFEAGADDYLTKPTHPAELANRVRSVLQRKTTTQAPPSATATPQTTSQKRGMLIGVLGVKGGVGATTLAVNFAAALLNSGEKPILADFQLGLGSLGLMLGANSANGLSRIIGEENLTPIILQNAIFTHQSGLRALVASPKPSENHLDFPAEKAIIITQQLRNLGNPAIIDLGHGLSAFTTKLLPEVDKLMYVVEANTIALTLASEQLQEIDDLIGGGRVSVVVINRAQSTLPWHEAENRLNREVKAIISAAPELSFQAIESQTPMVLMQPTAMVSGQFAKLADEMKSRIHSITDS
jgi:CheY-like chemotaxis protein/MinD-like ATPase involved in chromosome partitioning or flagellar assembly